MNLELRLYKRFDADLLSLVDQGFDIRNLTKKAIYNYANGITEKYLLSDARSAGLEGEKKYHARIAITDEASAALLKCVKPGFRNSFAKVLLRDSLRAQSLGIYFNGSGYLDAEKERLLKLRSANPEDVVLYPKEKRTRRPAVKTAEDAPREKTAASPVKVQDTPVASPAGMRETDMQSEISSMFDELAEDF